MRQETQQQLKHWDAVADGELDRVQVVAEVSIQLQNALLDLAQNFLGRLPLSLIAQMIRMARFIRHDPHTALID